jgi:hypothetical protein
MENVDRVIEELNLLLERAHKLKLEGENDEQDLGSLINDIQDTFR